MDSDAAFGADTRLTALDTRQDCQMQALANLVLRVSLPPQDGSLAQRLFDEAISHLRRNQESAQQDDASATALLASQNTRSTSLLAAALLIDLANGVRDAHTLVSEFDSVDHVWAGQDTQLFGGLCSAAESTHSRTMRDNVWWNAVVDERDDRLLRMELQRLQGVSRLGGELEPRISSEAPTLRALLADVLRLQRDVDPVAWLNQHRGRLCARLVLRQMLHKALPAPTAILAAARSAANNMRMKWRTVERTKLRSSLAVQFVHLEAGEQGFAAHLEVQFDEPREAPPRSEGRGIELRHTLWEGFAVAVDDRGFPYPLQLVDCQLGRKVGRRRSWSERLTLVGWPSLIGANVLTFEVKNAVLASYGTPWFGGELVPLPMPDMGPVKVVISVEPDS
jgi:hypothetical protein